MSRIPSILLGSLIGLALGLGAAVLAGRCTSVSQDAPVSKGQAVSEVAGSLAEVWLQYATDAQPIVGDAQADFLNALDADTRIHVTVAKQQVPDLHSFLRARGLDGLGDRLRIVEVLGPVTPWTRDRALALAGNALDLTLLVPPPPDLEWERRRNDWSAVWQWARARGHTQVTKLPLDFDAGDLILADDVVLFDANLLAKNTRHGFRTHADLAKALHAWTGRPALCLGSRPGDVPRYHMAMYVMPTGSRRALVGDPGLARALTGPGWRPGDLSVETEQALVADDRAEVQAQFDRAAADLRAAGWQVARVPVVAFDDRTYVTYTNAILETRPQLSGQGARRVVYLPVYASPNGPAAAVGLDAAAVRVWQAEGYQVKPIRVAGTWRHHGTIGCLVNVLRRGRL
ncbi:MAG: hypothetical protein ACOYOB_07715 [Myxococcota bacterium]